MFYVLILLKSYSPLWTSACNTVSLHFRRSLAAARPFSIPMIFKSSSTSSFHLLRVLPLFLVPSIVAAAICVWRIYVPNVPISFETVYVNDLKIICTTETWLNVSFCNPNLFPGNYFVFRADRYYTDSKLTRGGGVLTVVHRSFSLYM
jgi:hypothetical protein